MNTEYLDFEQKANVRKQYLKDLIETDNNPENIQRYKQEIAELDDEIRNIKRETSFTPSALEEKIKLYRSWIIVLILLVVVVILGSIAFFTMSRNDSDRYRDRYNEASALNSTYETEKQTLQAEVDSLRTENSNLTSRVSTLETENAELSKKADFMDSYIKVVAEDNSGRKVYHTYGCSHFDDSSFWAYNEAQVVNNSEYSRCPYCN